jgi:hypothetical protein
MKKLVYAYDPHTFIYIGPMQLDESDISPLDGEWMIPGNCLEVAPPEAPAGKMVVMQGGAWGLVNIPAPPPPPVEETLPDPEPLTQEGRAKMLADEVQKHMDAIAKGMGYDDIKTAVTYAEEPAVAKFQQEGQLLRAWRSRVWAKCYELLALVQAGQMAEPDRAALLGMLPPAPLAVPFDVGGTDTNVDPGPAPEGDGPAVIVT